MRRPSCAWIGSSKSGLGIEPFFAPYNSTEIGYTCKDFLSRRRLMITNEVPGEQEVFSGIIEWTSGRKWKDEVRTPLVCLKWPHTWELGDYFYARDITQTSTQWIRDVCQPSHFSLPRKPAYGSSTPSIPQPRTSSPWIGSITSPWTASGTRLMSVWTSCGYQRPSGTARCQAHQSFAAELGVVLSPARCCLQIPLVGSHETRC